MLALLDVPEFRSSWGLDDKEGLSLDDLACVMGVSRESVRRIEIEAIRKIRRALVESPETLAILQNIFLQQSYNQQ